MASDDDVVPSYHADAAHTALQKAGINVKTHRLAGLGHSIDERGMVLGGRFLEQAFAPRK